MCNKFFSIFSFILTIFILPFLIFVDSAASATYYMRADGTAAEKTAATGPCSKQSACMSISAHNRQKFIANDTIILCDDGGVYRDQLIVPSSGADANNVIFYQAASGDTPEINGSDLITPGNAWSAEGTPNIWETTYRGNGHSPWAYGVYMDGVIGSKDETGGSCPANLNRDTEYCLDDDNNKLYVYSTSDPDTRWTSPGIEVSERNAIDINNKDYVTIDGLTLKNGGRNININNGSENITLQNLALTNSIWQGIWVQNASNNLTVSGCTIKGSPIGADVRNSAGMRIEDSDNFVVSENEIAYYGVAAIEIINDNGHAQEITSGLISSNYCHDIKSLDRAGSLDGQAIELTGVENKIVEGVTISYNRIHDCGGSGIATMDASNNLIIYNILWNTSESKLDDDIALWEDTVYTEGSNGNRIYGNVIYNASGESAIGIGSGCDGNEVKNNIIYTAPGKGIYAIGGSGKENVCSNNITYDVDGADIICDAESNNILNINPLFTNVATKDFTLKADSPAKNAGASLGETYSHGLNPTSSWPESVSTLDQDSYGNGWEIGAHVFHVFRDAPASPTGLRIISTY